MSSNIHVEQAVYIPELAKTFHNWHKRSHEVQKYF